MRPAAAARRCLCALLALPFVALGLLVALVRALYPQHPRPSGELGAQLGCVRTRMPPPGAAGGVAGPMVQAIYPAEPSASRAIAGGRSRWSSEYFRTPAIAAFAKETGFPHWFAGLALRRMQVDPPRAPRMPGGEEASRRPVVIFSHGLFGCMEMYTQFGREVASLGAVYLAVEHEDGSACYAEDGESGRAIRMAKPPQGFDGTRSALIRWRRPMLQRRVEELRAVARHLSRQPDTLPELDMDSVVLVGHSFGAASVLLALQQGIGMPVRGAVFLDPWLSVVPDGVVRQGVPVPSATMISEQWAGYQNEITLLNWLFNPRIPARLAGAVQPNAGCVINGTMHQWISDATLWLPEAMLRRLGKDTPLGAGSFSRTHAATSCALRVTLLSFWGRLGSDITGPNTDQLRLCDPDVVVPLPEL